MFSCDKCKVTSQHNSWLSQHIKAVHKEISDAECDQCSYTASYKGHLVRHIKVVHDKVKNYQ